MSIHIIIDGYNLIRQSDSLCLIDRFDLQEGREALIDMLAEYRIRKPHRITVVFDGGGAPRFTPQRERRRGINVRFSGRGELADSLIKRMAAREKERALVVSSDQDIAGFSERVGAAVIGSRAFERRLLCPTGTGKEDGDPDDRGGWLPTTKKKGPGHRLSRKARKNHLKVRKL
jgi:predicted RNA-binding protein with PIN domain